MYHSTPENEVVMKSTSLLASSVVLSALSLFTGPSYGQNGQPTLAKIQSVNLIAIGHRETSVPFSYVDANNDVVGFSQDLCNKVIDAVKAKTKHPDLRVRYFGKDLPTSTTVEVRRLVHLDFMIEVEVTAMV